MCLEMFLQIRKAQFNMFFLFFFFYLSMNLQYSLFCLTMKYRDTALDIQCVVFTRITFDVTILCFRRKGGLLQHSLRINAICTHNYKQVLEVTANIFSPEMKQQSRTVIMGISNILRCMSNQDTEQHTADSSYPGKKKN